MSSADPFRDRVEQSDGSFPADWPRPEPGGYIIGEVTSIELSAGKYEQPVLGVVDEDTDREYSVWLPQHMREDIQGQRLQLGERVAVKYHGVKKSRAGKEYQNYELRVDPNSRRAAPEPEAEKVLASAMAKLEADPMTDADDSLPF